MKLIKKLIKKPINLKVCHMLACVVLLITTFSANGCGFIFHQVVPPDGIKKLRKF